MLQIQPDDIPERLPVIPYKCHPLYTAPTGPIRPIDRLIALTRVAEMATYVLAVRLGQWLRTAKRGTGQDSAISRALAHDGLFVDRLPDADRTAVLEAAEPYFRRLAERRNCIARGTRTYSDNQLNLRRADAFELFGVLNDVLARGGVLPAIRRHLGCRAELRSVTVQINDEWDTYWRSHFQERGLEPPKTAFFHMDNTYDVAKVIFYASVVGKDSGPFSYVPGTNRIRVGWFESLILRATDIWLDNYPNERPLFLALPNFLRRKAKFGDDIAEESEWARWLLERERIVTSSDGDILAFDVQGVHRGGMVANGERRILQIMIR